MVRRLKGDRIASGAAQAWFIAGAVPFVLAGGGHALATLIDTVRPTYFAPIDSSVLPAVDGTGIRFRALFPGGNSETPSMWRAWLGFNISHGLGLLTFGLLCLLIGAYDFGVVDEINAILPLTIAVSTAYLALALRFWFYVPAIVIGIGTACFVVAGVVSI